MILTTFLFIFTVTLVAFQLVVYWFVFRKVGQGDKKPKSPINANEPVSVIICARNEAANLTNNLPSILTQHYPAFEVIVVDDGSTDRTAAIVEYFRQDHDHLRLISLPNDHDQRQSKGKKYALQKGIEAAHYNHLLMTDADCYPLSEYWIREMAGKLGERVKIVLGFSPYRKKSGFLNSFIRFEGFFVGLQYLSFAAIGFPYMGVGRNLCIDKHLIESSQPFSRHSHLASGDDDLVVQQLAAASNTTAVTTRESMVIASPERSLKGWLWQKHRHITTSRHYTLFMKMMLGTLGVAQITTYPLIAILFAISGNFLLIACLAFLLLFTKFTVFLKAMKHLHSDDLWSGMLVYDFLLSAFYINLGFLQLYKGQKTYWK